MDYVKTDVNGLVRDVKTGAIINTNDAQLAAYRAKAARFREEENTKEELNNIKSEMSEIKALLLQVLADKK